MAISPLWRTGLALAGLCAATPALALPASVIDKCTAQTCVAVLDAKDLLSTADRLVSEHRFAEAAPLLTALENAPQFAMERQFLQGYTAIETGQVDEAIKLFRRVLDQHPNQTRVRLELARALQMKGKTGGADYHYRLAQHDDGLPPEVAATIQATRGLLRDRRTWSLTVDLGLAPDTNISNGTAAEVIDVNFGGLQLPMTLSGAARQQSGIGQMASVAGGYRFNIGETTRLLVEADALGTNYKGKDFDDFTVQMAAGPEFELSDTSQLSLQALGTQRWYGGQMASRGVGGRATFQHTLGEGQRLGVSLDARHTDSGFSPAYGGWQMGAYASYERVVARSLIANATLFGRRDSLQSKAVSMTELGANIGIGGELPFGVNAGISGGISQASFDVAQTFFSNDARKDLRLNARVHMGLRSIRMMGFSPSVTYSFSRSDSNITLYESNRHRFRFGLARYF